MGLVCTDDLTPGVQMKPSESRSPGEGERLALVLKFRLVVNLKTC